MTCQQRSSSAELCSPSVVNMRPLRPKPSLVPPLTGVAAPAKGIGHVLDRVKSWQHVIALGLVLAFLGWALSQGLKLW